MTSVTFPYPSITRPAHLATSTIHLPATTQTSLVNILSPLTTISTMSYPTVTCSLPTITSSVGHSLVVTTSRPIISNSVPQASVSVLASISYPLTSVIDTLTTSDSTLTGLTTGSTTSTISLVTTSTHPLTTATNDQASFSSILTTTHSHSGSVVVTSSPHSVVVQPHLLSTTTIQEDSLTKDVANSSDTSESTEDDGESPKSTKEGTLAAVLALRDQYSPGLSSSITTVAQQPPMVSLDHLWSSRGSPAVEEPRTEQVDKVQDKNETITHHSDRPTTTISTQERYTSPQTVTTNVNTPTPSLHHPEEKPVISTTIATSPRSPSPPTVTADVATTPSQSLDNTMGKYLQLLQQKQAEENSPPTTSHNTYKEVLIYTEKIILYIFILVQESSMTYNMSDK